MVPKTQELLKVLKHYKNYRGIALKDLTNRSFRQTGRYFKSDDKGIPLDALVQLVQNLKIPVSKLPKEVQQILQPSQDVQRLDEYVEICEKLGIIRIHATAQDVSLQPLASAKTALRIWVPIGFELLRKNANYLTKALENGTTIQFIHAGSNSPTIKVFEEKTQPRPSLESASARILKAEKILKDCHHKAGNGKIEIMHFTTEFLSSMIIVDESWGLFTPSLPPKRFLETPSFELKGGTGTLLQLCLCCYNQAWDRLGSKKSHRE